MKYLKDILYPFCSAIPAQTTFAEAPIRVAFPVGQARVVKENNAACYECYIPYVQQQMPTWACRTIALERFGYKILNLTVQCNYNAYLHVKTIPMLANVAFYLS